MVLTWMRRLFLGVALMVAVQGGIIQMQEARANPVFLPLIIGVTFHTFLGVATGIEMYDGAPKTDSAVGAKVLSVRLVNPADSGAASGAVRVPTTTASASSASIPAPEAASTVPLIPAPYSSGDYTAAQCCRWDGVSCSTTESCSACFTNYAPLTGGRSCKAMDVTGTSIPAATVFASDATGAQVNPAASCAVGYVPASGACGLSNPRAVVADGNQDLTRSGQAFSTIADDLKGAVNAVLSTATVSNDSADVSGISVSGSPRVIRVTAKSDGGSEITVTTQKKDGADNTYLEKRNYTVSSGGNVTSAGQGAYVGTLGVNAAGTGYTTTGGTTAYAPASAQAGSSTAPTTGSGTCGATGQEKCNVRIDETGTEPGNGAATAVALKNTMDAEKAAAVAAQTSGDMAFTGVPKYNAPTGVGNAPSFGLSGSESCSNPTGTLFGNSVTFPLCTVLAPMKPILAWMLNVLLASYAWFAYTRRNEGVT